MAGQAGSQCCQLNKACQCVVIDGLQVVGLHVADDDMQKDKKQHTGLWCRLGYHMALNGWIETCNPQLCPSSGIAPTPSARILHTVKTSVTISRRVKAVGYNVVR